MCPTNLEKNWEEEAKQEKFICFLTFLEDDMMWCVYICLASPPFQLSCQLYRVALNVPQLSLFKSAPLALFCDRHIKEQLVSASLDYVCKLAGVSHLDAEATQCPMLYA